MVRTQEPCRLSDTESETSVRLAVAPPPARHYDWGILTFTLMATRSTRSSAILLITTHWFVQIKRLDITGLELLGWWTIQNLHNSAIRAVFIGKTACETAVNSWINRIHKSLFRCRVQSLYQLWDRTVGNIYTALCEDLVPQTTCRWMAIAVLSTVINEQLISISMNGVFQ